MKSVTLQRRGVALGEIEIDPGRKCDSLKDWAQGKAVQLSQFLTNHLGDYRHAMQQSESLVLALLEQKPLEQVIDNPPYDDRWQAHFTPLGSSYNEGDEQEIETLLFDAIDEAGETIAEDIWLKASWLSFHDEDASLRFRFSFGVDLVEDVAADPLRQALASQLADCVFPESAMLGQNSELQQALATLLDGRAPSFVERIVYFNAPNGGAYLHHDRERGHAGVVYAQLSGSTFWLALPETQLIREIQRFCHQQSLPTSLSLSQQNEIQQLCLSADDLSAALNSFQHDALIHLINETPEFIHFLHQAGYSKVLHPGDLLLLPQASQSLCCWHSVFCIGEEMGQALSFAIR